MNILINENIVQIDKKKKIVYNVAINHNSESYEISKQYSEFIELYNKENHKLKENLMNKGFIRFLQSKESIKQSIVNLLTEIFHNETLLNDHLTLDFLQVQKNNNELNSTDFLYNLAGTENKKACQESFDFIKLIGSGNFGKVYLAKNRSDGKVFAVKVLNKSKIRDPSRVLVERDVLVQTLKHPFLCHLHYTFQSKSKLFFVLDYINGGELFFHLSNEKRFTEEKTRFYVSEICCALGYLHEQNIIYRDLKTENVLLDCKGHIILTDFGLCKQNLNLNETTSTFCGSPEYLAPEILRKENYDRNVDWWCVGIVAFEMLTGLPPFYSEDHREMYNSILYDPLKIPKYISEEASILINGLLAKDPKIRLGSSNDFDEIKKESFFASIDFVKLLEKKITPPFKPNSDSAMDTQNISEEFTELPISQSVVQSYKRTQILDPAYKKTGDNRFNGFTFVQKSILNSDD